MSKGRCLGLVGGLGVGATIHYYEALAKAHQAQGRTLDIVIAHAETQQVFAYVQAGDRAGLAAYLAGFIRRLQAGGAEVAAITGVTPYYCVRELIAASPLPLFNIFEPLIVELRTRSARRIAIFGTRFVMESDLFGMVENVDIVLPHPDEVDTIHNTYLQLLQHGKGSTEQHRRLTAIAHTLCERDEVDTIVFAGTDLALLFNDANTDFPHIDCAALHLQAIISGLSNDAH